MKSDAEKIEMCKKFLRDRGFSVFGQTLTPGEIASQLRCTVVHVHSLDIPSINTSTAMGGKSRRVYPAASFAAWMEKRTKVWLPAAKQDEEAT